MTLVLIPALAFATTDYLAAPARFATPGRAAASVFGGEPRVIQVNHVGDTALVEVRGGIIEGSTNRDDVILVRRYAFGWQGIDSLKSACATAALQRLPMNTRRALLQRMPRVAQSASACDRPSVDHGPANDIAAVRGIQDAGGFLPSVTAVGNYASVDWYGKGGGVRLYHHSGGTWTLAAAGGGALNASTLREHGVPANDVCKFPVSDCPRK